MTGKVFTLSDSDGLLSAVHLFEEHGFAGFPVLDRRQKLVGILTEYDLLSHGSGVHIPTVMGIFSRISVEKKDSGELNGYFKKLRGIKVKDVMNNNPLTIRADSPAEDLAGEFYEHHKVNPILVVDKEENLVGVVSRHDLIRFFNENYLRTASEETPRGTGTTSLSRRETEGVADRTISEISHGFSLVSARRRLMWKIIAIISFVIGFMAALVWALRIVSR